MNGICNLADDTTPYACDIDLSNLLYRLEYDTLSAIMWFDANYMKLNQEVSFNFGWKYT